MRVSNPTRKEFELSTSLRHYVWEKNIISGGKQQLKEIADSLNYKEKYPWIYEAIFGTTSKWARDYPKEYLAASSLSCGHRREDRTPAIFALDMYANWIAEDLIVDILKNKCGFEVLLNGTDKNRTIAVDRVSNQADLCIRKKGGEWHGLEISISYTNLIQETHKFRLRDDKYKHLKNEKALILQMEFTSRRFVLFSPYYDEDWFNIVILHNFSGYRKKKDAYQLELKNMSNFIDIALLSKTLNETLERVEKLELS